MIKEFKLSDTSQFIKDNFQMLLLQKQNFNEQQYKQLIEMGFLLTNLNINKDKILFEYKQWSISTNIKPYELELNQEIIENNIISLIKQTEQFKSALRDFKLNSIIND